MATVSLDQLELPELVERIPEPNRSACKALLHDHGDLLRRAPGSSRKHHAYSGGYWIHVTQMMNEFIQQYALDVARGLLETLPLEWQYCQSDGLLVIFCHDLEKPFRYEPSAWRMETPMGACATKAERAELRLRLLEYYGFELRARHVRALELVEGLRDCDYSPTTQLMWPLGLACHQADYTSAVFDAFNPRSRSA